MDSNWIDQAMSRYRERVAGKQSLSILDTIDAIVRANNDLMLERCHEPVAKHLVIDSLGHERAVSQSKYETKRTEAVERQDGEVRFFDEVKDLDHFKRRFATWDFSQFAR